MYLAGWRLICKVSGRAVRLQRQRHGQLPNPVSHAVRRHDMQSKA
jgi:hypothetical protein